MAFLAPGFTRGGDLKTIWERGPQEPAQYCCSALRWRSRNVLRCAVRLGAADEPVDEQSDDPEWTGDLGDDLDLDGFREELDKGSDLTDEEDGEQGSSPSVIRDDETEPLELVLDEDGEEALSSVQDDVAEPLELELDEDGEHVSSSVVQDDVTEPLEFELDKPDNRPAEGIHSVVGDSMPEFSFESALDGAWDALTDDVEDSEENGDSEERDAGASGIALDEDKGPYHADPAPFVPSKDAPKWYFLQIRTKMEATVQISLGNMVRNVPSLETKLLSVIMPVKKMRKYNKAGRRVDRNDHVFPGYLLLNAVMDEELYNALKGITHVQGFVGDPNDSRGKKDPWRRPEPLSYAEVERIFAAIEEDQKTEPTRQLAFKKNDLVLITSGPFQGNEGKVCEVFDDEAKVAVAIVVFGKESVVTLDFTQITAPNFA